MKDSYEKKRYWSDCFKEDEEISAYIAEVAENNKKGRQLNTGRIFPQILYSKEQ